MSLKLKSPSRLRRDQYRMSVYNCCKQILEIERKDEEIMVQQDQISLMNEIHFRYLENIERLEKQLKSQKFKNCKSRLAFKRAVTIDIPPVITCSKNDYQKQHNWPD